MLIRKLKIGLEKNADYLVKNNPEKILNGDQLIVKEIENNIEIQPSYWNKFSFKKNR